MYKNGFSFDYDRWYIQGIVMWVYFLLPLKNLTTSNFTIIMKYTRHAPFRAYWLVQA